MSYGNPFGQKPEKGKPKIWSEGGQRPPFDLRALGRASLHLSRVAVAPILGWSARTTRRVAVNVKGGVGRISADRLAGAARFLPSHLRVAGWIKNVAATLSHASASADPDVKRGNALVAEIAPHLWTADELSPPPQPVPQLAPQPLPEAAPPLAATDATPPVTLPEPVAQEYDPLASIREKLANQPPPETAEAEREDVPDLPPDPPGPLATNVIQVSGYLIGWGTAIVALPYGLIHALWLYFAKSVDLRGISAED
jgi:hypothetical protein